MAVTLLHPASVVSLTTTGLMPPFLQGIETAGLKMNLNPFCEVAVEEAVRLKERGLASEARPRSSHPGVFSS